MDEFARCVRERDYSAAHKIVSPDIIGFGSITRIAMGRSELESRQWRHIWESTTGFAWHTVQFVSQGDLVVVFATWSSYRGSDLRRGRATIALRGDQAVHTHFSLDPS